LNLNTLLHACLTILTSCLGLLLTVFGIVRTRPQYRWS
jgi:hypothetical protein